MLLFLMTKVSCLQDIPDIVGDKIFGIQSFTVRLGQKRVSFQPMLNSFRGIFGLKFKPLWQVFWFCILLLEMAYAVALFAGVTSPSSWSKWTTVTQSFPLILSRTNTSYILPIIECPCILSYLQNSDKYFVKMKTEKIISSLERSVK